MKKLICQIFGHKYFAIKEFPFGCRKVGCRRCAQTWGMNDSVEAFVEWDGELEHLHNETESFMQNLKSQLEVGQRAAQPVVAPDRLQSARSSLPSSGG